MFCLIMARNNGEGGEDVRNIILAKAVKVKIERMQPSILFAHGIAREGWRSTSPVRAIFRRALASVDMPYVNPHRIDRSRQDQEIFDLANEP